MNGWSTAHVSGWEMRLDLVFINDTEKLNCFITANEDLAEGLNLDVK